MLNMIAGVYPVDSGKIMIDGQDVTKLPEFKRAKFLGRVFQDPMNGTAADMQILENLALASRRGKFRTLAPGVFQKKKRQAILIFLKSLDLGLETRLTSKVGLLSGGQRHSHNTSYGNSEKSRSCFCLMSTPLHLTPKQPTRCLSLQPVDC